MMKARCWNTADELASAVADRLTEAALTVRSAPAALMLAGGTTPLAAYARLTSHPPTVFSGLHVLFSDDRHVAAESPHSNYGQIAPMLKAWALPDERILRVHGEQPLEQATTRYASDIGRFLDAGGVIPLGLLGLGADGHTASLFSAEHIARGQDGWAQSVQRPDGLNGVSVTPHLLREVQHLIFVVSGRGKREMAHRLVHQPATLTAGQAVAGHRAVEVWMDREAWPFT